MNKILKSYRYKAFLFLNNINSYHEIFRKNNKGNDLSSLK